MQNYSPVVNEQVWIRLTKVPGETYVDWFRVPLNNFYAGYSIETLSSLRDFNGIELSHPIYYEKYEDFDYISGSAEKEVTISPNLKISSVPYDLTGMGV